MKFVRSLQSGGAYLQNLHLLQGTWENRSATIAGIAQFVISAVALVWVWRDLPPKIPLWYSKPWGVERLAHPVFLFVVPITALIIYGINRAMLTQTAGDHPLFGRVLSLTSLLASALSCIIVIRIITLVT